MTLMSGIILAGGRATRMQGQDKGLVIWQGRPLIEHVLARIRPQVDEVVISCNRHSEIYSHYSACQTDLTGDFAGPLAGILACLPQCSHQKVLVVACDMPLLPPDLASRLLGAMSDQFDLAVAHDGAQIQPLAMLLDKSVTLTLEMSVKAGFATVHRWIREQQYVEVKFDSPDAFMNINTLEELKNLPGSHIC